MNRLAHISHSVLLCAVITLSGCHHSSGDNTPPTPTTSTVGGNVSGLSGSVVLQINGGGNITVTQSGAFTFGGTLTSGTAYTVSILTQPTVQTCVVTNSAGSVSGGTNVTNVTVTCSNLPILSGVAAVGAPLVGTVTVKDALGAIKTVTIGTNGAYTVNVAGMTGPFVLRAEGTANGVAFVVHSAATSADFAGTINVTQLTDLALANVGHQPASLYFDAGNFSAVTKTSYDAEINRLRDRLLPVLQALGVSATADLLRVAFTPGQSGLDAALDALHVTYDATTHLATVTNIVTHQQIQDDITVSAASEAGAPTLTSTGGLATVDADMDAVRAALASFAAKFATALPTAASLQTLMSASYLTGDEDRAEDSAELAGATQFIGGSFTDVSFKSFDYTDPAKPTAIVDFSAKDSSGREIFRGYDLGVRKESDGVWRLLGDQRVIAVEGSPFALRDAVTGCTSTGIEFLVGDEHSANNGGTIDHLNVFGPGLPAAGLRYRASGGLATALPGSYSYVMADSCGTSALADAAIAAIPDHPTYLVVAYSSADDSVRLNFPSGAIVAPGAAANGAYSITFEKRPLTLAEATASTAYPAVTAPTSAALASYNGGALTIAAGNVNPKIYAKLELAYRLSGGARTDDETNVPVASDGKLSAQMSLPTAGGAVDKRTLIVTSYDASRRSMMTAVSDPQFKITGTISGLSGSVTLRLNGGNDIAFGSSGAFAFVATLPNGAAYNVSVASLPATQICAITAGGSGTIAAANVTNVAVTCKNYSVAGTAAGLTAAGLVLTVNGGNDLAVAAAPGGAFAFPASAPLSFGAAASYRVLIKSQPAGQTCTILHGLGVINFATPNVSNVAVTCVANVTDVLSGTYRAIRVHSVEQADSAVGRSAYVTFYPDGTYIFAIRSDQPDCGTNDGNGLEYGAYSWNQTTGQLRITASLDTNGECGIHDDVPLNTFSTPGVNSYTFTKNPDGTLSSVFDDDNDDSPFYITWAPVTSTAGTLIGAWGDNQFFDVFNPDGTLFSATTLGIEGVAATPGIEDACYTVPSGTTSAGTLQPLFNGACMVHGTPAVDTTGVLGYSLFSPSAAVPFTVNGDVLQKGTGVPVQRISAPTYAVSGTITGLTGTGLALTLNGQRDSAFVVSPAANGTAFKFQAGLPAGATFTVFTVGLPQTPTQLCGASAHGFGTIGSSDVTDVAIACGAAAPFTVGGTVSGLTASGLTLRLTTSNYLSSATTSADLGVGAGSTSFTFPGQGPAGGNFTVGIATQPTGQTCTLVRGRALVTVANVTNVGVACVANPPSALIGTYAVVGPNGAADFSGYFNFNADGTFTTALIHNNTDCNTGSNTRNGNGIEYGTFNWNSSTGLFTMPVEPVIDTNGECGFDEPDGSPGPAGYLTKVGNTLEFRETPGGPAEQTVTAVESIPNTIVGAFVPAAGNGRLLVFRADGTFLWADVQGVGFYPLGYGQERGCYTYSTATHEVTLSLAPDCKPDGIAAYDGNGGGELFPIDFYTLTFPLTIDDASTITFAGVQYKRNVPTFGVSGTVTGLSGSVTLRLNGDNDVTLNASGPFNFGNALRAGDPYLVSVGTLPNTQACGIVNGSGTIAAANVTNVTVNCVGYSLGGSVTSVGGALGTGLVLQTNGGNDLAVAGGSANTPFAFPGTISLRNPAAPGGTFYFAHIKTQPAGQTCTIQNSAGAIPPGAPNVTSVAVTCVANVTDPLSGTYRAATYHGAAVPDRVYLTFYPDGTYIVGIHAIPSGDCAPGEPEDLIEYGVYRYTQTTSQIAIDRALHFPANGCGGFDDDLPIGQFTSLSTLTKNPDGTVLLDAGGGQTMTFTPVESATGTLIGSWGDNQGFDVYGSDGTLFSVNTRAFVGFPAVTPGIEDGCYLLSGTTAAGSFTLNFSGTCAVSGTQTGIDTSGPLGYSLFSTQGLSRSFTVTGDSLLFTGGTPIPRITTN